MSLTTKWIPIGIALLLLGVALANAPDALAQDEGASDTTTTETTEEPADTGDEEVVVEEEETAEEEAAAPTDYGYAIDNAILFLCAVLVLFMQAGFAMVEVGLNAAKNTVNILSKNVMDLSVGALLFFAIGFGLMYPGSYKEAFNPYFDFGGFGIYEGSGTFSPQVDWFFQAVFAATAATIVSGAVAGRMQFGSYLVYSAILTGLIYPISGMWKWGGGWLGEMGFQDFAGSAVVHGVGGFAGLAGAIVLGPRLGRYVKGKSVPMPGHNLAFATLGVFVLWVGWYGFNPGSQLAFQSSADINATVLIAVNTTLAAAAGAVVAMFISWAMFGKPDLTMALNGALGGLVGITACCDAFTNLWSIVIGAIAGAIVVGGVVLLDKLKIDDPVGAFPVHGLCGVWGCMALGILPNAHLAGPDPATSFMTQLIGTAAICGWSFVTMLGVFLALKAIGILRVSPEEEEQGLDYSEHGMHAYPPHLVTDSYSGISVPGRPVTSESGSPAMATAE